MNTQYSDIFFAATRDMIEDNWHAQKTSCTHPVLCTLDIIVGGIMVLCIGKIVLLKGGCYNFSSFVCHGPFRAYISLITYWSY